MEPARRCGQCRFMIRFCPCCGTALGGKSDHALGSPHNVAGSASLPRDAAFLPHVAAQRTECSLSSLPWIENTAAWRRRLPRRPVSAYEVYLAAVYGVVASKGEGKGAASLGTAPAAEGGHHSDREVRAAAALSWLRMAPADKCPYEQEAQAWEAHLGTVKKVSVNVPARGAATALSSSAEAPTSEHLEGEPPSAASLLFSLPSAEQSLSHPQKAPRVVGGLQSKTHTSMEKRPRGSSSFALFRSSMKGRQKMSMREVSCVWRHMSVEEKAPYDTAAAARRTERFLAQASSSPHHTS
ncbi:hypothetical protein JKF63_05139 [Porcisia hertigi]|uniref:Uncharacterized protein n=1 Tax=Porcisia hertigi TaxID=2761500 RepID=A0A836IPW8_9TRYP|nr:hypothetical protein JKF63_05139 [Porcisia hertigi]